MVIISIDANDAVQLMSDHHPSDIDKISEVGQVFKSPTRFLLTSVIIQITKGAGVSVDLRAGLYAEMTGTSGVNARPVDVNNPTLTSAWVDDVDVPSGVSRVEFRFTNPTYYLEEQRQYGVSVMLASSGTMGDGWSVGIDSFGQTGNAFLFQNSAYQTESATNMGVEIYGAPDETYKGLGGPIEPTTIPPESLGLPSIPPLGIMGSTGFFILLGLGAFLLLRGGRRK